MPTIRVASIRDAAPLARLAERTFRDTFASSNTSENMELHCQSSYGEAIQASELKHPAMQTLVCEEGGALIGFAQLRWGDAPPCVSSPLPGELLRLYVERAWHGKGVAQSLMQASLEALQRHGSDTAWLGVWEHNPRAIAFYRKFGFVEVGEHVFPVGTDPQRDVVMTRWLGGG